MGRYVIETSDAVDRIIEGLKLSLGVTSAIEVWQRSLVLATVVVDDRNGRRRDQEPC